MDATAPPSRRPRVALLALLVWLLLLGLGAGALLSGERDGRRELRENFEVRVQLAARFSETYAANLAAHERRRATKVLSGPDVSREEFEQVVGGFEFEAAVLLDDRGRLLQVFPSAPKLLGVDLASRYAHLTSAVAGRAAVSKAVPSAARGIPVVAFAVPYETPQGRRVFSGAFDITTTPIATYLVAGFGLPGREAYLVDTAGTVVASSSGRATTVSQLSDRDQALAAALPGHDRGSYGGTDGRRLFAAQPVAGTPWRLVVSASEHELYAVLAKGRVLRWLVLAVLGLLGLGVAVLVTRYVEGRHELAESARRLAEANQQLRDANEKLQEANQFKTDMLGMLGHEIGTPLNAIVGYAELLQLDWANLPDEERREMVAEVGGSGRRLTDLVREMLQMCRLDAGAITVKRAPVPLAEAVGRVLGALGATLPPVEVDVPPDLEVLADPGQLEQIITNLLTNANKYGASPIVVDAGRDDEGMVVLRVTDHGNGVPESLLPRLFERFSRGEHGSIKGTGLGLFIISQLAGANGATLTHEPNQPTGARFVVRLEPATDPAHSPAQVS